MKKIISLIGMVLFLGACTSSYHRYSDYEDIYYDDYYYDSYYYDDDLYAYNYYPDRWGMNYSNVYYSPYRYPRVGFYNHYYYYPSSYWGSYSPWSYSIGFGFAWSSHSRFYWSSNHWYNNYYDPFTSYYYASYWNRYWNNHYTRRHISARNEVARIAAGNRRGSSYSSYNSQRSYQDNYRSSHRSHQTGVSRNQLRPSNRERSTVGRGRTQGPTPSQQPFTATPRGRNAQRPSVQPSGIITQPSRQRSRADVSRNSSEPIFQGERPRRANSRPSQKPERKPEQRYRGSIYNSPINTGNESTRSKPAYNRPQQSATVREKPSTVQRSRNYSRPTTSPKPGNSSSRSSSKPSESRSRSSSSRSSESRSKPSTPRSSSSRSSGGRGSSASELKRRR